MTWAFEEANSKLLDYFVSVADVEAKELLTAVCQDFAAEVKWGPLRLWQRLRLI